MRYIHNIPFTAQGASLPTQLRREGFISNRKAVQRHMREMGISGICPGPNPGKRNRQHQLYPYLLRNLDITHPNHVWGIDITYIQPFCRRM